jgi:hypothetical protein
VLRRKIMAEVKKSITVSQIEAYRFGSKEEINFEVTGNEMERFKIPLREAIDFARGILEICGIKDY